MIEQLFFELIRIAIGLQNTLSRQPSAKEWQILYNMAKKQSLIGICFAGIQRLINSENGNYCGIEEQRYLTWMGMAAKIQQRNEIVNRQCVELQAKLTYNGLRSSILKGQPVASIYPEHLRGLRQSGDIDIYVDCGRKKAIEYAQKLQGDVVWDYKHLHLGIFPDTEVEMHYMPEVILNLWKNRKLQKKFKAHQEEMFTNTNLLNSSNHSNISTPSVMFNLFYILLHAYRHFLYEGVGLRQLMDYYFVLCKAQTTGIESKEDIELVKEVIKSFGMLRFTRGVMWIMKEVFGLSEQLMLCEPDEKEGGYILKQVMMGGNFGHHDERLANNSSGKLSAIRKILKHNLHLLTHYPSDVIWAPIWIVYHKIWKLMNRKQFKH